MKISKREKLFLNILAIMVICLLAVQFLLLPMYKEYQASHQKAKEAETMLNSLRELDTIYSQNMDALPGLEAQYNTEKAEIVEAEEIENVDRIVSQIATQSGIAVSQLEMTSDGVVYGETIEHLTISLRGTGDYAALTRFADKVKADEFLDVLSFSFSQESNSIACGISVYKEITDQQILKNRAKADGK